MITNIFPSTVYSQKYGESLIEECKKSLLLKSKIKCGGDTWIHKPLNSNGTLNIFLDKDFDKLSKFFDLHVENYTKQLGMNRVRREQAWLNFYKKGDSQEFHDHNFSAISGVFYLKGNKKDAATIIKSPLQDNPNDSPFDFNNPYTWKNYRVNFEEGKLLLFKSSLQHCVEKQKEDSERITISFNYSRY